MKDRELITVCIPTYNRAHTILYSINSILKQSYQNIEILIIDNASTDNTREVVASLPDPRIKYLHFSELLEVNYNFLRAVSCAETEIVCLFHSDDYYFPNIIEEQLKYLTNTVVGAVFSKMIPLKADTDFSTDTVANNINKTDSYDVIRYNYKEFLTRSMTSGIPVSCPTFMTKKSVIKEVGLLDKKDGLLSDLSLWLPIVKRYEIVDLQIPLMFYVTSQDQLSFKIHHNRIVQAPQFIVLDRELATLSDPVSRKSILNYQIRKSKDYIQISKNLFASGRIVSGLRYLMYAFGCLLKI